MSHAPMPGDRAVASVAATSANLGPGFDALGLALDLRDEYRVELGGQSVQVTSVGVAADEVPTGADHLVARALLAGLAAGGVSGAGFRLQCRNTIPHGRGLGSSAAAIVGGLALAAALLGHDDPVELVWRAAQLEGHPDNVAAAALGGLTISWTTPDGAQATNVRLHPSVVPVLFVPDAVSPTAAARQALPATVPHADAAFNAARSALLVAALTAHPEYLFTATEDRLHQEQRRGTYPEAMALVDRLRGRGWPAAISGAGPAVIVPATADQAPLVAAEAAPGYQARVVAVGAGVRATRQIAVRA